MCWPQSEVQDGTLHRLVPSVLAPLMLTMVMRWGARRLDTGCGTLRKTLKDDRWAYWTRKRSHSGALTPSTSRTRLQPNPSQFSSVSSPSPHRHPGAFLSSASFPLSAQLTDTIALQGTSLTICTNSVVNWDIKQWRTQTLWLEKKRLDSSTGFIIWRFRVSLSHSSFKNSNDTCCPTSQNY